MFSFKAALAALALTTASFAAQADCTYPKSPDAAPNGSTATKDEMVAGMQQIKKYNEDMTAYLECIDKETEKRTTEAGEDEAKLKQIKDLGAKKHNAAMDELTARTDEFNTQVRAYRAKQKT